VTAIMRNYGIKHSASLYEHARATGLDAKRAQAQIEGKGDSHDADTTFEVNRTAHLWVAKKYSMS